MKLNYPVPNTYVTSPFGNRTNPVTDKPEFHNGVDLHAPTGTIVRTPLDGNVIESTPTAIAGKQIRILHTNGYITGYADLAETDVNVGDDVVAGQQIGITGQVANETGAHLHFTYTDPAGNKVDPEKYFTT